MSEALPVEPNRAERSVLAGKLVTRTFYSRPVLEVARQCIGKVLVRSNPQGVVAGRIVEAEAYRGPQDRAAHSFGGRRTRRTEAMFGRAGVAYVFFVYGMHWHLNLVAGNVGEPQAVLIRGVEPLLGIDLMAARRKMDANRDALTNGPGKLCVAFAITGDDYGTDLCRRGPLYLLEGSAPKRIARSPRIGIDYAGSWAARPWRFFDPTSRHVSKPRPAQRLA